MNNFKIELENLIKEENLKIETARNAAIDKGAVLDSDGKLHAPCDNYVYEAPDGDVALYQGGEYLPDLNIPEKTWNFFLAPEMVSVLEDLKIVVLETEEPTAKYGNTYFKKYQVRATKVVLNLIEEFVSNLIEECKKSNAGTVPTGRITATVEVVNVKVSMGNYGVERKCIVQFENGSTAWGTLPKELDTDFRGKITMTSTITQSEDDPTFGFFKRPKLMKEKQ